MLTADHMMIDRRIIQEAETLARHGYEVRLLAGFECEANTVRENGGVRIERFVYEISEPSLKGALRRLLLFNRPFNALTHLWRKVRRRFTGVGAAVDRFENFVLEMAFLREFVGEDGINHFRHARRGG